MLKLNLLYFQLELTKKGDTLNTTEIPEQPIEYPEEPSEYPEQPLEYPDNPEPLEPGYPELPEPEPSQTPEPGFE